MRYLAALLLIIAAPATAQTTEERLDRIIAEATALKAELAKPPAGDGKIVVAAEGDSIAITWEYSHTGLYKAARPDVTFHGLAVGGSGIKLLNDRLPALLALKPDLVSVHVGANDLTNYASAQAYADALKLYTDQIRATGAKVVVTTVLPRYFKGFPEAVTFTALHNTRRKELAAIIKAATWIDGVADFAANPEMGPDAAAYDKLLYYDGVHPTNDFEAEGEGGQVKLFRIYKPVMDKLAVDRPLTTTPHVHTQLPYIDNSKIPAPSVGFSTARIKASTEAPKQNTNGTGQFRITCEFSHMNYDDPIVYAGQKGASHLHTYFGNAAVNYASTQTSIETTGDSTCAGGTANRTGYWVPAVIDTKDGTPLKPSKILVYYKNDIIPFGNVQPYPAGLRIVSGDMRATEPQNGMEWNCYTTSGQELRSKGIPADCPVGGTVEATINFPMCWNGKDLDSPDHKSHMATRVWNNTKRVNECPASHPVLVPSLTEKVQYRVTEVGSTARWRLSSDNYGTEKPGGYSIHADWFNGWDAKVQETWVKNCLQANKDCHGNLLGDGTTVY